MWKKQTISRKSIRLLFLTTLMALTLMAFLPAVNATVYPARDSYAYITVSPNPVGRGQDVLLTFGNTWMLPSDLYHWTVEVYVTKPGETAHTKLDEYKTDSTGSTYDKYVPDEVGTWYFECYFPETWLNYTIYDFFGNPVGTSEQLYKEDWSEKTELTVQEEPVGWLPSNPPPTDYWERPIYNENWEWSQSAGNWLNPAGGETPAGFAIGWKNLYTDGPESGHIMWTREIDFGGVVGGEDLHGYYSGLSYERKFACIILQGRVYYNLYPSGFGGRYAPGFACVDLRTGEELWRNEEGTISFGQVVEIDTPNQHGAIPYIWGGSLTMYNAFSGIKILDIQNVSRGSRVTGPNGEILIYNLYTNTTTGKRMLSMWNSTRVQGLIQYMWPTPVWRPSQDAVLDGSTAYQWRIDVSSVPTNPALTWIDYDEGVIVCKGMDAALDVAVHCAYAIKDIEGADAGDLLWTANRTGILALVNFVNEGAIGEGVYTEYVKETRTWYAFDALDGDKIWETAPIENQWAMYHGCSVVAYGNLYSAGYDGCVHCYSLKNGTELWSYYGGDAGYETPYGHYPFFTFHDGITVADGKVYAVNGEHSPSGILYKGEKLHCMDAYTGKGIWNISCWGTPPAVADGYVVTLNHYDGRIYCYGKGKSETTAAVSQQVITNGSKVLITGTITDQSAAQPGTPCVSKESMSDWMGYLHMQKPQPTVTTGVPVLLLAMRLDGSIIEIGTAISYTAGFAYEWTPPDEDLYTITATFYGDESYGSSWDATHVLVTAAPPEPPPTEEAEAPAYTAIELAIIAAVVVAIVIGIVNLYALRKR